jgi:hypothetical protein
MTEEDEAFEDLAKRQGDWGMQGSRKHQIMRYAENVESKGTSMTNKEAMAMALEFIERVNKDGWILADFEPQMYEAIAAIKDALAQPEQEPVALLERDTRIGRLRVTYEDAVTDLEDGFYFLYTKPQIEIGCAECGVNGNHALYCIACTEQFLLSEAIKHEREECASLNIPITTPQRDYLDMSPLEIYEEALMDATLSFRAAIRARGEQA